MEQQSLETLAISPTCHASCASNAELIHDASEHRAASEMKFQKRETASQGCSSTPLSGGTSTQRQKIFQLFGPLDVQRHPGAHQGATSSQLQVNRALVWQAFSSLLICTFGRRSEIPQETRRTPIGDMLQPRQTWLAVAPRLPVEITAQNRS
jgi:hypothetical protein